MSAEAPTAPAVPEVDLEPIDQQHLKWASPGFSSTMGRVHFVNSISVQTVEEIGPGEVHRMKMCGCTVITQKVMRQHARWETVELDGSQPYHEAKMRLEEFFRRADKDLNSYGIRLQISRRPLPNTIRCSRCGHAFGDAGEVPKEQRLQGHMMWHGKEDAAAAKRRRRTEDAGVDPEQDPPKKDAEPQEKKPKSKKDKGEVETIICPVCDKGFPSLPEYDEHIAEAHEPEPDA